MNGTTFNASTFTLAAADGTAVTGNVSYITGSSTAVFTPASPLAYNTAYTATITTGVQTPAGTALGKTNTWSFTTAPGTAPTVTGVTPSNGSTGVVADTTVEATFSEAMNASTITSSTFTLTGGGASVTGTVSADPTNTIFTFTPSGPLTAGTTYTASVTTGAVAATGSALANADSWTFTTAQGSVPTVISTSLSPADGATGIPIASAVTATFSEAMDPSTVTGSTFTLTGGGVSVTGAITADPTNTIFTFTPSAPLAYGTAYTALITTGVQAASQAPEVPLAANYTWSFTTVPPPPATVTAVTPASGSTGLAIAGTTVTATFSAPMIASTINPSTFTLTGPSGSVPGTVTYNSGNSTATLTPLPNLAYGATYTATINSGAMDSLGVPLSTPYTWTFTTVAATVPTIASVTPITGATSVSTSSAVTATFNESMNASTLTTSTFTLAAAGLPAVTGTVTYNTGTLTAVFTPSATLASNTAYTATITTGAQGATGAALASNYTWNFTTGASPSSVAVSFGTTYQTIRGFGGAEAWQPAMTAAQVNGLYGSGTGQVGLSIMRLRIDPSSITGGTNWDTELSNGLAAQKLGAIVFATPWTPPAAWKTNGSVNEGSLNAANYADFANYLESYVNYATSKGVNLYAISMQNEPDWNPCDPSGTDEGPNGKDCYESCLWTGAQMDTWVAQNSSVLTTKLIMPESFYFNKGMSDPTLNDSNAVGHVAIVGGHLYGSAPYYYTNAENQGKDVWMTEHAMTIAGPANTPQSITDALNEAVELHNSMTVGQYNAYVYWWMINSSAASPHLIDTNGNMAFIGSGMAQFARFVRPGYLRASATANPVTGVYVSAYTNASPAHYVIVAINNNTTAQTVNFTLSDAATKISSLTAYATTSAGMVVQQTSPVTVTGGQFQYPLPPQSIVTFVQ